MNTPMPDYIRMNRAEWDSLSEKGRQAFIKLFTPRKPTEQERAFELKKANLAELSRNLVIK